MKVRIIRPTIALKKQVFEGDVLDVSQKEAAELIGAGKAVALKESQAETTALPLEVAETTDVPSVNTETFEPVVKRSKTKKASE